MLRKIININKEKCNGCGLCVSACHEGAIGLVEGKAVLLRDDYCDGLGDCLPVCPTGAISFEEREALDFNEAEVKKNMEAKENDRLPCGCPGTNAKAIIRDTGSSQPEVKTAIKTVQVSELNQWPVQIKLVPVNAVFFQDAHLLICADCAAYAYGNFHNDFMKDKITLIGCPKLDEGNYTEKLLAILMVNDIRKVTVVRMDVPCCSGIENAAKTALYDCGKMIPWHVVTISTDGNLMD